MKKVRWGIIATGNISDQFVDGLKLVPTAEIAAVASRSSERAATFAEKHDIAKGYGSYEDMLVDESIDIIYIGTPHTSHLKDVLMCLNAGFNVLCEKPMGVNAKETALMVDAAREKDLLLMEGMWTRFFPAMKKVMAWIDSGKIGEIKMLTASFGWDGSSNRQQWRFSNEAAGGALLDVGIYPLALAFSVFGTEPEEIVGLCKNVEGVDEANSFIMKYSDGQMAVLSSAITAKLGNALSIEGELGQIVIRDEWWCASKCELMLDGDDFFAYSGEHTVFDAPYGSTGFQFEAEAACDYIVRGLKESPLITLDESIRFAQTMDKLREMWKIKYPADK